MLLYGWLGGVPLFYDEVHDMVFLAGTGLVVLVNGSWCFSEDVLADLVTRYKDTGWV